MCVFPFSSSLNFNAYLILSCEKPQVVRHWLTQKQQKIQYHIFSGIFEKKSLFKVQVLEFAVSPSTFYENLLISDFSEIFLSASEYSKEDTRFCWNSLW